MLHICGSFCAFSLDNTVHTQLDSPVWLLKASKDKSVNISQKHTNLSDFSCGFFEGPHLQNAAVKSCTCALQNKSILELFYINVVGSFTAQTLSRPLVIQYFPRLSIGLHHDPVPAALLEGRAAVLPEHKQPEHDVRQSPGEENLGSWYVLCPLQALVYPRYHDW